MLLTEEQKSRLSARYPVLGNFTYKVGKKDVSLPIRHNETYAFQEHGYSGPLQLINLGLGLEAILPGRSEDEAFWRAYYARIPEHELR